MSELTRHVHGPARVQCILPGGSTWARWGINSRNADIRTMAGMTELPSDEQGQGIHPADIQFDGAIAEVTLAMTGWDEVQMSGMLALLKNRTEGTFIDADIGALLFAGGHYAQVYLESTARTGQAVNNAIMPIARPWFFPCVFVWPPTTQDVGTRFSTKQIVLRCFRLNPNYPGVLYQRSAPSGVLTS